ncbi:MAG: type II secretion system protein [Deltaproteobacteria bacterium]|nr:type II secretion system protein [Deltaproteobacteria bacterium]
MHSGNLCHTRKNSSCGTGFTLIEIMIALGILALSLGAIFTSQSNAIRTSFRTEQLNTALFLAQMKMEETLLEQSGQEVASGPDQTGSFEEPYETYKWKVSIQDFSYDLSFLGQQAVQGGEQTEGGQSQALTAILPKITEAIGRAVKEITVTVSWPAGEGEKSYSVTSHLLNFKTLGIL